MCAQNPQNMRQCVICNRRLVGRSDKVFCDIKCKNYYHREIRMSARTALDETVSILRKNYIILTGLMGENSDKFVIDKLALEKAGFNFNHITGVRLDNVSPRYFIFELSFEFIKKNRVKIGVDTEREIFSPFVFKRWARTFSETKKLISA